MAVIVGKPIAPIYWPISYALSSAIKGDNNRAIAVLSALLEAVKRESFASQTTEGASTRAGGIAWVEGMQQYSERLREEKKDGIAQG